MYKPKVYTASKLRHIRLWRTLYDDADWNFVEWTASWVKDHAALAEANGEPVTSRQYQDGWVDNINDVKKSDFLLLYSGQENALRGALIEAGVAIAQGIPVLTVSVPLDHTWVFHPLVRCFSSLREARNHLYRYTTMAPPNRKGRKIEDE